MVFQKLENIGGKHILKNRNRIPFIQEYNQKEKKEDELILNKLQLKTKLSYSLYISISCRL